MTMPALYQHCVDVYEAMDREATMDEMRQRIYRGSLTRLIGSLGLSNPYYTSITKSLKAMDCIRQAQRGGGGSPSVWYLLQPPSEPLWREYGGPAAKAPSSREVGSDQVLRALNERINRLEDRVSVLEAAE